MQMHDCARRAARLVERVVKRHLLGRRIAADELAVGAEPRKAIGERVVAPLIATMP
jgi:hypothetical protein